MKHLLGYIDVMEGMVTPDSAEKLARGIRNKLLLQSDFSQMADVPMSEEARGAWRAYRQELRDLPEKEEWPYIDAPTQPEVY